MSRLYAHHPVGNTWTTCNGLTALPQIVYQRDQSQSMALFKDIPGYPLMGICHLREKM